MKCRCFVPNANGYHSYGGRGITVCDRWKDSFENFYKDMGRKPENKSLDRIDPNGHYEPKNCRWATAKEQQNNRRVNRKFFYRGKHLTASQICEKFESVVGCKNVYSRLKAGWSVDKAISSPLRKG